METPAGGAGVAGEISLSFLKPIDKEGCLGTIGPYEVLEVIGRGGMGLVLRAVDLKLNRVVAVKVLIPELAANPNARRRFLREAQAAAAISHPHVVTIHAVEEASDGSETEKPTPPYLVMECVVGQSLQQKLDAVGPFRIAEIVRISRQISEGLAAAHRQGVIHRDIKPANILLENGVERVKITDFGLARAIDDITVTRTGEVSGTPQYMSPEQANGERVDHRSDLFSLGCVMYAMCTGHSPFRGDSIAHVIKRVTQDTPRPILEQCPEIPVWLVQIVDCLLDKSADKRLQSAEGVAVILEQHLARIQQPAGSGSHTLINQQVPTTAPPSSESMPAEAPTAAVMDPRVNRHRVGTWFVATGALLLFCLVAWFVLVAVEVLDPSQNVRRNASSILATCLGIFAVVMMIGMLLRGEILGNKSWTSLFKLSGMTLLGPLGIWYWMSVLQKSSIEDSRPKELQARPQSEQPASEPAAAMRTSGSDSNTPEVQQPESATANDDFTRPSMGTIVLRMLLSAATAFICGFLIAEYPLYGQLASFVSLGFAFIVFVTAVATIIRMVTAPPNSAGNTLRFAGRVASYCFAGWLVLPFILEAARVGTDQRWRSDAIVWTAIVGVFVIITTLLTHQRSKPAVADGELPGWLLTRIPNPFGWLVSPKDVAKPGVNELTKRLLFGFAACFVAGVGYDAWQGYAIPEYEPGTGQLFIRHDGEYELSDVLVEGERVTFDTRKDAYTIVTGIESGLHDIAMTMSSPSERKHTLKQQVWIREGTLAEVNLWPPVEFGAADELGPADSEYGGLILDIAEPDIHVLLLGMGPTVVGYYPAEIPAGRHKVPAGRYSVMIFDKQVGWLKDIAAAPGATHNGALRTLDHMLGSLNQSLQLYDPQTGAYTASQYSATNQQIEIKPGEFQSVVAARDLKKIVGRPNNKEDARGYKRFTEEKFYRFLWNGKTYSFSALQARVVNELLQRMLADTLPADEESVLTTVVELDAAPAGSISEIFNNGQHPAWGEVVQFMRSAAGNKIGVSQLLALENKNDPSIMKPGVAPAVLTPEQSTVAPPVVMSAQPAKNERAGYLQVTIEDDGMRLVVRRKSAFGGYVPGSEQQVTTVGFSQLRLHPGDYEVGVQDRLFGWDAKFVTTDITVGEDNTEEFLVKRDLAKLPKGAAGNFRWEGEIVRPSDSGKSWNEIQAHAINLLISAAEEGVPNEEFIRALRQEHEVQISIPKRRNSAEFSIPAPETIADVFDPLPNFIVPGTKDGTLRLAPAVRATVQVKINDPGLQVTLRPTEKNSNVAVRTLDSYANTAQKEYRLPSGQYKIVIADQFAYWSQFDENGFLGTNLTKRSQTITLNADDQKELTFRRQLNDLADFDLEAVDLRKRESLRLYWRRPSLGGGFGDGGVSVTLPQAKCLQRLIAALAAGTPDVSEEELFKLTGTPWFETSQNSSVRSLVVPGQSPETWRMRALKAQ